MNYVLDTNIISEFTKPRPNPSVIDWAHDHNEEIFLNTVTLYELYYGIFCMPEGKLKKGLLETIDAIAEECSDRILGLDAFGSYLCAKMRSDAQRHGRQVTVEDAMIAAICQRNNATLVTHNTKDFEHFNIPLVDPFDYESETLKQLRREEAARRS